jgi:hypothetical protein
MKVALSHWRIIMATGTTAIRDLTWPTLPLVEWKETFATLHMWTQIVGKVRMALSPHLNHWWEVPLYVSAVGLTTSPIPYGAGIFEIEFDFIDHRLDILTSWGERRSMWLASRSVADFYHEFMEMLQSLGIKVLIWPMPVEVSDPIRFDQDHTHATYDPEYAQRFWHILTIADEIFKEFRADFIGKASPVHFFWGSFDLAVTRFSGRLAPERPNVSRVEREAYSHEVSSAGLWPGGAQIDGCVFYSYAVPEPQGFNVSSIRPKEAFYDNIFHEYMLRYEDVRVMESPKAAVLNFLRSTYEAAANLGHWDRQALEMH